jgi:hypothetical protein
VRTRQRFISEIYIWAEGEFEAKNNFTQKKAKERKKTAPDGAQNG